MIDLDGNCTIDKKTARYLFVLATVSHSSDMYVKTEYLLLPRVNSLILLQDILEGSKEYDFL